MQLQKIFQDVEACLAQALYHPALATVLSVPDICIGLTQPREKFVKREDYEAFLRDYAPEKTLGLGLEPEECYRLRGGVIHRANAAGHAYWVGTHVVFTLPTSPVKVHGTKLSGDGISGISLDLGMFCSAMNNAAINWFEANRLNENLDGNLNSMLTIQNDGIPNLIVGIPVLASLAPS